MYKEVQFAMVELHTKVVEAFESLNAALKVYMDKRASSEKQLLDYCGIDLEGKVEVSLI